jgi:hypothetical protein
MGYEIEEDFRDVRVGKSEKYELGKTTRMKPS